MLELPSEGEWEAPPEFRKRGEDWRNKYHNYMRGRVQKEVECVNNHFQAGGVRASVTWFPMEEAYMGFINRPERPHYPEIVTTFGPIEFVVQGVLHELGKYRRV